MNKTKIEWCDSTWNPVTGCLHGCEYCYARRIANRFGGGCHVAPHYHDVEDPVENVGVIYEHTSETNHVLDRYYFDAKLERAVPYPYYFDPTFHRYKLNEPARWTKPKTIFVCSMADLFGEWVPDSWIEEVFAACEKAPQHRYLFLTKNPRRYVELAKKGKLPERDNMWYGSTVTTMEEYYSGEKFNTFLSIEPILSSISPLTINYIKWIIIGAETGNRKGKVVPKKEWIDDICKGADETDVPIFMKDSMIPIVGEENMRREFPWTTN